MVLTGTNRERGTRTAATRSKAPMAAPIAVSSCSTAGERGSFGSTVFRLTISGRSGVRGARAPRGRARGCWCCRSASARSRWNEDASGAWAVSRSTSRPSREREVTALTVGLGAAVRPPSRTRAARRGEPGQDRGVEHRAEVVGVGDEGVAGRARAARRASREADQRGVEVAVAGGRHSSAGSARPAHRRQVVCAQLRLRMLEEEPRRPAGRASRSRSCSSARAAATPSARAWRAMTSRKVCPSWPRSGTSGRAGPCWCRGRR